jgi:hypothetical protein
VIAMKMSKTLAPFLIFGALGLGCHPAVKMQTPNGFAELGHPGSYSFRAASAHGVVLAMRSEKNEPRANLDFWKDAVDARVRRQGYTPEGQASVKSADGCDGRQLRYVRVEDQRTYRYWLTLFVVDDRVVVVEAGGDRENFDPAQTLVEKAVLSAHVG